MPHVAKEKLEDEVQAKLYEQLAQTLSRENAGATINVCNDLLTETEQEMLSKRLAMIIMFAEGASVYRVTNLLNVSPSTAQRMRDDFESGKFSTLEEMFAEKSRRNRLWGELADLYKAALPAGGHGPWHWYDKVRQKEKQE